MGKPTQGGQGSRHNPHRLWMRLVWEIGLIVGAIVMAVIIFGAVPFAAYLDSQENAKYCHAWQGSQKGGHRIRVPCPGQE